MGLGKCPWVCDLGAAPGVGEGTLAGAANGTDRSNTLPDLALACSHAVSIFLRCRSMNRSRMVLLMLVALASVLTSGLTGCSSTAAVEEHRVALPEGMQKLAVDVENFRGIVELRGDRGSEGEAMVRAQVVTAWDADKAAREVVRESVDVEVVVDEEQPGLAVLRVRTGKSIGGQEHAVVLYIETPRVDGTRIVNEGGYVEVVGVRGALHIENRFGMIEVRTDHPVNDRVTLLNTDGPILARIGEGSEGVFDLETLDGQVSMRISAGEMSETRSGMQSFHTVLNEGQNMVLARTNAGDIRVAVTEEPQAYARMIKQTMPDLGQGLFLDGSRRHTRNLPEDEERRDPATFAPSR